MTADQPNGLRFWLRVRRLLQAALVIAVFGAVWLVGFRPASEPEVLPDTSEQFSLDLSVSASLDHDLVYVVEQRARPKYRIFSFDPDTGADETVFTVPEDAIIYGISLHPDRSQLAVSYSTDFNIEGNGVWLLDLETLEFTEVSPTEPGIYLTELEWALDGSEIFATHVDRRADTESLAIASVSIDHDAVTAGTVEIILEDAITPAVAGGGLFHLTVDEEKARRAIGVLTSDGAVHSIEVLDGERDLDHLTARADRDDVFVAVLDQQDEGLLSFGTPVAAHGNHNVQSSWWSVDTAIEPTAIEPIIVYDAATSGSGAIVYATLEGLSIADGERVDLIRSRAIRFVAA